jgi:hypothetical protein
MVYAPVGVLPHRLGEEVQDVGDPLLDDVGGLGLGDGAVEEHQELAQSGLVHHVHLAQLNYQEVEDAATCCHRPDKTPVSHFLLINKFNSPNSSQRTQTKDAGRIVQSMCLNE